MVVTVNQDLCKACGICGHICPRHIPETKENEGKKITTISMQRIDLCMACGHCVAVCPNGAIQVNGLGVFQMSWKVPKTLQDFVMPGLHWYIRWYREGKSNEILRDCPTLMLFHSPINEPVNAENCLIVTFHAILMAQVLGIGDCFNDLIPPACYRVPGIRKLLELPDDREVYASITMGYPKYKFNHIPPRKLGEVRYLN